MVRSSPRSRPETLERPHPVATRTSGAALADARCELAHGRTSVVFPVALPASVAHVWTLLVDPVQLERWSPFTADRTLSQVGRVTLRMLDAGNAAAPDIASVVFVADRDRRLEYSWADDTLSWTLDAGGDAESTRVTLRQTLANAAMASAIAAGWHLCLQVAESLFDEHPMPPIRGMAAMDHGWADLNRRYAKKFGVAPTRVS